MNLAAPLFSALILSLSTTDFTGYELQSEIVPVLYVLLIFITAKVHVSLKEEDYDIRHCLKDETPFWKAALIHQLLYGVRDGLLMSVARLLLYDAIEERGSLYSILTALFSCLAIAGYEVYRRSVHRDRMISVYGISGIVMIIGLLLLAWQCSCRDLLLHHECTVYTGLVQRGSNPHHGCGERIPGQ